MCVRTKDVIDIYSSNDPQLAFHKRITFCMNMYTDAVKAMEYPKTEEKKDYGALQEKEDDEEDKDETNEEDIMASLMEDFDDL
jgi:26S proteasome regulatory subunit N3